jgi:hypothetical protein
MQKLRSASSKIAIFITRSGRQDYQEILVKIQEIRSNVAYKILADIKKEYQQKCEEQKQHEKELSEVTSIMKVEIWEELKHFFELDDVYQPDKFVAELDKRAAPSESSYERKEIDFYYTLLWLLYQFDKHHMNEIHGLLKYQFFSCKDDEGTFFHSNTFRRSNYRTFCAIKSVVERNYQIIISVPMRYMEDLSLLN